GGYRVQIYSDNNARTAKNEARTKERAISGAFPELATYVIYDSPYWRLRVGDCRSRAEAEELASRIKNAFPSYRSEITVVRDRINTVD
ncbi:MAG: SPOR domain-containing protein, partial [Muribaculaceae bacterium]|nr:SPOR domain-containing protein [Muribaculaceae bacterium]